MLNDLRYALRTLLKSSGFTAVALLTLALGIGANTAIFSFVNSVLLTPLPYPDADRIVRVLERPPGGDRNGISTLTYLDWQNQNTVFDYMAAQTADRYTLTGHGDPVQLLAGRATARYFDIFGITAALGRTFAPDEDQRGKDHVVVLGHALWVSQFGASPAILNQTIVLNNESYTVIGVLPAGSAFDRGQLTLWTPLAFQPENMTRNFHWFGAFAKLKRGVTLEQARAQMDTVGAHIAQAYPDSNKGWGVTIDRYADTIVDANLRQSLYVLLGAVGMLLLIGCANLANLTLARGAAREREVAVRSALGAGRHRLIRQFLTENVLLSVAGGILGIGVGYATMALLNSAIPPDSFAREIEVRMDLRVLLFALALSAFTGILFGLAPALGVTKLNLVVSLKEGARGSIGSAGKRLRGALVIAEIALAFILLTGAGLLIRSFFAMQRADLGFDSTNVLTAQLPIVNKRFPDPAGLNQHLREILANIQAVPGVRDAAFASTVPLRGWGYGMPFQIAGQTVVDVSNRPDCFFKMVTPSYFLTVGMRLLKGRALTDRDGAGSTPVAVINQTMARKYFANQDPLGQHILIQKIIPGKTQLGPDIPWEVVGVVADERVNSLDNKRDNPGLYVTIDQTPVYFGGLVVRAAIPPERLQRAVEQAVHNLDRDQALVEIRTLDQIKSESMVGDRLQSLLLGIFATVALLLASIGIYGVISYSVTQRTGEIGIRAALGASQTNLLVLVLQSGFWMTGVGLLLGVAGALGLTRLLSTLLYQVGEYDPLTLAFSAVLLACVGLLACYIPARRAARVDPAVALRSE